MTFRKVVIRRTFYLFIALAMLSLPFGGASAQQFLGKARQACTGVLTVATSQQPVTIQPFKAEAVDVGSPMVNIICEEQQPITVECPANTNRVLIDRTQGPNVYSIICLRN